MRPSLPCSVVTGSSWISTPPATTTMTMTNFCDGWCTFYKTRWSRRGMLFNGLLRKSAKLCQNKGNPFGGYSVAIREFTWKNLFWGWYAFSEGIYSVLSIKNLFASFDVLRVVKRTKDQSDRKSKDEMSKDKRLTTTIGSDTYKGLGGLVETVFV